jgi:hypothetical protein
VRERKWGQQPTTQVVFEDTKTKMYNPYANMAAARREDVTAMREERVAREMAREGNYAAAIALEQDAQRHRAVASVERAVEVLETEARAGLLDRYLVDLFSRDVVPELVARDLVGATTISD